MIYPLLSEYIDAISSAEDNFEELNHLRPVLGADGKPYMSSGNFAVVFKMQDPQGKLFAVKCFTKEQPGREEAYTQIAQELQYVESPFLTSIQYLNKELFVDTQQSDTTEFPVVLMDWVDGIPLDAYAKANHHNANALNMLSYKFSQMAMWLLSQPFAHGDLKPDNILVHSDGSLVLVDYDGMYVPAMKGQKARELGSPDYCHPLRTEKDFNQNIDDFALSTIALSLKAISLQPDLLDDATEKDVLLLTKEDFRDLSSSETFAQLSKLCYNAELSRLLGCFLVAHSTQNLFALDLRLFMPEKPILVEEEILSTKVTEEDLADAWIDEYGVKYSKDGKRLLKVSNDLKNYTVRNGTKVICDWACWWCKKLSSITLPNSVTQIGDRAFGGCSNLDISKISMSNNFIIENGLLYNKSKTRIILSFPKYVPSSITLPNSVTEIGKSAFSGCNLNNEIKQDLRNRFGGRIF